MGNTQGSAAADGKFDTDKDKTEMKDTADAHGEVDTDKDKSEMKKKEKDEVDTDKDNSEMKKKKKDEVDTDQDNSEMKKKEKDEMIAREAFLASGGDPVTFAAFLLMWKSTSTSEEVLNELDPPTHNNTTTKVDEDKLAKTSGSECSRSP